MSVRPAPSRGDSRATVVPLLALLRQATAAHHRRLDAGLALGCATLTRERYAAFLEGSLRVLLVLEPALRPWPAAYDASPRIECLREDLRALDADADPARPPIDVPVDVAGAFGAAYVVEGSALGGRVLAPMVQRVLGASTAVSYLRLRGEATQPHWTAWLARLRTFDEGARPGDRDVCCAMACATFGAYTRSLTQAMQVAA